MPICHIVLWKLKSQESSTLDLFKPLYQLKGPTKLEVGPPLRPEKSQGYNYGLYSLFNNMEDLQNYIVDPDHVKVVESIKPHVECLCKLIIITIIMLMLDFSCYWIRYWNLKLTIYCMYFPIYWSFTSISHRYYNYLKKIKWSLKIQFLVLIL